MELHYNPRVENLCGLIDAAFDGVVLGDGIGLWEAQALDDYDDEAIRAHYREKDEKEDWRKISYEDLNRCNSSPSFFDAAGFRFHLPAFMQAELREELYINFYFSLISFKCLKYERYLLLNPNQRMAVRAFLLFLIEDDRDSIDRADAESALAEYWTEESCRSAI